MINLCLNIDVEMAFPDLFIRKWCRFWKGFFRTLFYPLHNITLDTEVLYTNIHKRTWQFTRFAKYIKSFLQPNAQIFNRLAHDFFTRAVELTLREDAQMLHEPRHVLVELRLVFYGLPIEGKLVIFQRFVQTFQTFDPLCSILKFSKNNVQNIGNDASLLGADVPILFTEPVQCRGWTQMLQKRRCSRIIGMHLDKWGKL